MDTGEIPEPFICQEEDYRSAMAITAVLIRHTLRVWCELSSEDLRKPSAERSTRQHCSLIVSRKNFSNCTFWVLGKIPGIGHTVFQTHRETAYLSGVLYLAGN